MIKRKILKAARKTKIRMVADFSSETMQSRRQWNDISKVLKENMSV